MPFLFGNGANIHDSVVAGNASVSIPDSESIIFGVVFLIAIKSIRGGF